MNQPPLPPPPGGMPPAPDAMWAPAPAYIVPPQYAGFWIRVAGSIIDSLVLIPLYVPFLIVLFRRIQDQLETTPTISTTDFSVFGSEFIWWAIGLQLVRYLYEFVMIGQWNATVGKFAVGIRVRRTDGSPATWREAALRPVLELMLGILNLGVVSLLDYLWMLWDKQKQTLHDKVASTIVVRK
jgi:uncharacterized RDD family membrane protein YckC